LIDPKPEGAECRHRQYLAVCGIAGSVFLGLYFGIPALMPRLASLLYSGGTPSTGRTVTVGAEYHALLAAGGWLQGIGALLCVVFFLALVQWADGISTLAGRVVLLGCAVLLALVVAEMVFTFAWAVAAHASQPVTARAAYDLMARFIEVFPIVPAATLYLALATVLASGPYVVPAIFTRLAAALGIAFFLVGLAGVLTSAASALSAGLSGLQDVWTLAAAITVLRGAQPRPRHTPHSRLARLDDGCPPGQGGTVRCCRQSQPP
jgi:hypothetical protein